MLHVFKQRNSVPANRLGCFGKHRYRPRCLSVSIVAAALLCCLTVLFFGCGSKEEGGKKAAASPGPAGAGGKPAKKPPLVKTITVQPRPLSRVLQLTGNIVSTNTVTIRSTLDGPIAFCPWREGDTFTKGTKLFEIKRPLYDGEAATARAALAVQRAKLADLQAGSRPEEIEQAEETVKQFEECTAFAKSDLDRIDKLVKKSVLPAEVAEKARVSYIKCRTDLVSARSRLAMLKSGPTTTAVAVQKANVEDAEARLKVAQARLAETRIEAPFNGVVVAVHVRAGDMAMAKAPLITIRQRGALVARFAAPERDSAAVELGKLVQATVDAQSGKVYKGKVVRVYPNLDRSTRTRTIEAELTETGELAPGMFARLQVTIEHIDQALVVPDSAVMIRKGKGMVVAVVNADKVEIRSVRTGIETTDQVQIVEGIAAGERVVVEGNQKLKPGMTVRTPKGGKENATGNDKNGGGTR